MKKKKDTALIRIPRPTHKILKTEAAKLEMSAGALADALIIAGLRLGPRRAAK